MYLDEHAFVRLREEEGRMEIARRPTEARLLEIVLHEQEPLAARLELAAVEGLGGIRATAAIGLR